MDIIQQIISQLTEYFMQYGVWGLIVVSFIESSFFPIIPDVFLIPLAIAKPQFALLYGALTTVFSVLGALLGWWIGLKAGRPFLYKFFSEESVAKVEAYFQRYGGAALAIAGFTPLPYKLFTIASGMVKINIRSLVLWSLLGRGARFMLEAAIIVILGDYAARFISDYLGTITVVAVLIVLFAYIALRLYRRRASK